MKASKIELIEELQKRVEDKILEPTNFELLKKLIERADTLDEAIMIAELGTTYKRTGFHFDKRLEKVTDTIKYFKKNEELSFVTDSTKKTHKLIIGDNYPALLNLLIENKGAIDVIYIDPPYGKDSMGEFAQTNYENAITRDNLLSMLYPRLLLAKMLLSDEGVIFCSIDDKNHAYVKALFDDVFGEKNFITSFVWQKKKGGGQAKYVYEGHEYVLTYAKQKQNIGGLLVDDEGKVSLSKIIEIDGQKYIINDDIIRVKFGKYESGTERRCYYEDILEIKGEKKFKEVEEHLRNKEYILIPAKTDKSKHYVCSIMPLDENKKKIAYSFIVSGIRTEDGNNEIENLGLSFVNPKPCSFIKILINLTQKKEAIVLDFFSGSGTTGQAALELNKADDGNRQFILVTNNEITEQNPNGIAYDVTTKRLKRVMTGECYDGTKDFKWLENNAPLGDNLDVYEIAEVANFESTEGKTPFDVIDETLYGVEKFATVQEKVEWVCDNFEITQKKLEEN